MLLYNIYIYNEIGASRPMNRAGVLDEDYGGGKSDGLDP